MIKDWQTEDLQKTLTILKKMIEEEKDYKRKTELEFFYCHIKYNELPENIITSKPKDLVFLTKEIIQNEIIYNQQYNIIYSFYKSLQDNKRLTNSIAYINRQIEHRKTQELPYRNPQKIIKDTQYFFRTLPPQLSTFQQEIEQDLIHINFSKTKSKISTADIIYIEPLKEAFINVYEKKDLSLIHEFGHLLSYHINSKFNLVNDCLNEFASTFFELIWLHENILRFPENSIIHEHYARFMTQLFEMRYLNCHSTIIKKCKDNNYNINNEFIRKNFDKHLQTSLKSSIDDEGTYVISFISALALFRIYTQNKKKGIELFLEIAKKAPTDSLGFLFDNINVYQNAQEQAEIITNNYVKILKH